MKRIQAILIKFIFIISSVISVGSCEKKDAKQDIPEKEAYVTQIIIDDSINVDESYSFKAIFGLPNTCYQYKRTVKTESDRSYYFQIIIHNSNYNYPSAYCVTMPYKDTMEVNLSPKNVGKFKLYFNDSALTKEIFVY